MTSDYSRALDLDALANRYIMVERVSNKIKKKCFCLLILLFLLQINHRLLDCCIIAIILKQFPLCDSKGIQGACTFKVNCNHCAWIIKKMSNKHRKLLLETMDLSGPECGHFCGYQRKPKKNTYNIILPSIYSSQLWKQKNSYVIILAR